MFSRASRLFRIPRTIVRNSGGGHENMTEAEFYALFPLPGFMNKLGWKPHQGGVAILGFWVVVVILLNLKENKKMVFQELEYDIWEDVPDFEAEPMNFFFYLQSGEEFVDKALRTLDPPPPKVRKSHRKKDPAK